MRLREENQQRKYRSDEAGRGRPVMAASCRETEINAWSSLLFEDHGDDAMREDRVQHVHHLLRFLLRHQDRRSQHHEPDNITPYTLYTPHNVQSTLGPQLLHRMLKLHRIDLYYRYYVLQHYRRALLKLL